MSTPTFTANSEAQAANPPPQLATPQRVLAHRTPTLNPAFPPTPQLQLGTHKPAFDARAVNDKLDFATLQLVLQDIYGVKDDKILKEQADAIFTLCGVKPECGSIDYVQFETQIASKSTHEYNRLQQFDADVQFTQTIGRKKIRDGEPTNTDLDEEVELAP